MSYAESPELTVLNFFDKWTNQDPCRLTAELVSVSKETNRKPDTYYFGVRNGLLIDSETQKPILEFISPGVEYEIAEKLQTWAAENKDGLAYWVSPRLQGKYPCEKIIIHKIAYTFSGEKVVMNSVILFGAKLEEPEELRKTLFTCKDSEQTVFGLLSWVKQISGRDVDGNSNDDEARTQAIYFARQIKSGVDPQIVIQEMQQTGFLGRNPISCPTDMSFSKFVDSRASINIHSGKEDKHGSLNFKCPRCKNTNTRPYGKLISNCQHCGADVTC